MLKTKIIIKNKDSSYIATSAKRRGRPPKTRTEGLPRSPLIPVSGSPSGSAPMQTASRVYDLSVKSDMSKSSTYIVNNLVQLRLTLRDVEALERRFISMNRGLLVDVESPIGEPSAWNADANECGVETPSPSPQPAPQTVHTPVLSVGEGTAGCKIKTPFKIIKQEDKTVAVSARRDLIINSGVKRLSKPIMNTYNNGWPSYSPYACWYCCHKFNTTPVGIPHLLINNEFHCYGNFCSYNCAKRFLRPRSEDDLAMLQTTNDIYIDDDLGDKLQLLELLYHIETDHPLRDSIKPAPSRLTLTLFGGDKSIEEFRENFASNNSYHIFRAPLVPISYQMEECVDRTDGYNKKKHQRVSLDTMRIERAFRELTEKRESVSKKMSRA